jgi:hypothetical protein
MANISSKSTQFSNGVSVGPIFPLNASPGTPLASWAVYDIAPWFVSNAASLSNVVLPVTTPGAGYLTLAANIAEGTKSVNKFSLINILELDVPRAILFNGTAGSNPGILTVTGFDEYSNPMQEAITPVAGAGGILVGTGLKAFKWITAIYYSAASATNIQVSTSNVFGLPWRVDSANYISASLDPRNPGSAGRMSNIAARTVTLAAGSVIVPYPYLSVEDPAISLSYATNNGNYGYLTYAITPGTTPYLDTLTISSTDGADANAVNVFIWQKGADLLFNPAYQAVTLTDGVYVPNASTLTTPDVRGTIYVDYFNAPLNTGQRLTAFAYVLGSYTSSDPTIQALQTYSATTLPTLATLRGYPQFWAQPNSGT